MANSMRESDVIYLTCDMTLGQGMREIEYQLKRLSHIKPRIWFCDIVYPIGRTPDANRLAHQVHKRLRGITIGLPDDNYAIYLNLDVSRRLQARDAMMDQMQKRGVTQKVNLKRANKYDKNALASEPKSNFIITD